MISSKSRSTSWEIRSGKETVLSCFGMVACLSAVGLDPAAFVPATLSDCFRRELRRAPPVPPQASPPRRAPETGRVARKARRPFGRFAHGATDPFRTARPRALAWRQKERGFGGRSG